MYPGYLIPVKTWAKCGRTVGEYQAMPPKTRLKLTQSSCMGVDLGYRTFFFSFRFNAI